MEQPDRHPEVGHSHPRRAAEPVELGAREEGERVSALAQNLMFEAWIDEMPAKVAGLELALRGAGV